MVRRQANTQTNCEEISDEAPCDGNRRRISRKQDWESEPYSEVAFDTHVNADGQQSGKSPLAGTKSAIILENHSLRRGYEIKSTL